MESIWFIGISDERSEITGDRKSLYFKRGYNTEHDSSVENVSFDDFPFEYPVGGHGDFRIPAFAITQEDGITFANRCLKAGV